MDSRSPPWASSPPGSTNPDTRLLHRAQATLDSRNADVVGSSSNLTEEALEVVGLEPGGRSS